MKPKITIITITYNSEKTLERTIKSIINQNYDNLEYIVVDGGSSDGTIDIIKKYDRFITKWISEADRGISDAFNKGIGMATGEIIGIINSDDGLMEGALDTLVAAYDPVVDVYSGKQLIWNEISGTKVIQTPSMHYTYSGKNSICHPSTFIAKRAYEKYGAYDIEYRYVMDYDLLLRFDRAGANFKFVDSVLAFFTTGGVTYSAYTKKRHFETESMLLKNGATKIDLWVFRVICGVKRVVIKVLGRDISLVLRNRVLSFWK